MLVIYSQTLKSYLSFTDPTHMWNGAKKGKGQDKTANRYRNRVPIHLRRINAKLDVIAPIDEANPSLIPVITSSLEVRIVLNDLSTTGVGIYASAPLTPDQEVMLSFTVTHPLSVKFKVVWCQEHNMNTHILSAQSYTYRMGLEFMSHSPTEKAAIESLVFELSNSNKAAKESA